MTELYGWPYCVERMRPRAKWRAVYDDLYEGLTTGHTRRAITCRIPTSQQRLSGRSSLTKYARWAIYRRVRRHLERSSE